MRCRHAFGERRIPFPIGELAADELGERERLRAHRAGSRRDALRCDLEPGRIQWMEQQSGRLVAGAVMQAYLPYFGRPLGMTLDPNGDGAVGCVERPADFDAGFDLACSHLPGQSPRQPAGEAPRLDDRVRPMLQQKLSRARGSITRSGRVQRLPENAAPILEAAPVHVGRYSPAAAGQSYRDAFEPVSRARHSARGLEPAAAVVDDLLSVFGEIEEERARE